MKPVLSVIISIGLGASAQAAPKSPPPNAPPVTREQPAKPIPPGIARLLATGTDRGGQGHGAGLPNGRGLGWGHLLHDHDDDPVSP